MPRLPKVKDILPQKEPYWWWLVEIVVLVGLIVALMLASAHNPSWDDIARGIGAAAIGFIVSRFSTRQAEKRAGK